MPLPCPFPGCPEPTDVMLTESPVNRLMYVIRCYACGLTGPLGYSRDGAVTKWNALPRNAAPREGK